MNFKSSGKIHLCTGSILGLATLLPGRTHARSQAVSVCPRQELEAWLESWPRGVVYVSFGTNADPAWLGARPLRALRRVLGALPHGVLWPRAPPPLPANVRAAGWLPQADLLREYPPPGSHRHTRSEVSAHIAPQSGKACR